VATRPAGGGGGQRKMLHGGGRAHWIAGEITEEKKKRSPEGKKIVENTHRQLSSRSAIRRRIKPRLCGWKGRR